MFEIDREGKTGGDAPDRSDEVHVFQSGHRVGMGVTALFDGLQVIAGNLKIARSK
jgi:hypothetical protein